MHITEKKTHRLSRRPTSNEQEVLSIKLLLVCMSNDLRIENGRYEKRK